MSKSFEVTGTIHNVGQVESFGQNGFTKREFVILITGPDEKEQYPNHIALELTKERCTLIDTFNMGQEIKVQFNLGGRLWAGNGKGEKCFNSLTAWKIEATQQAPTQQRQATPPAHAQVPAEQQFDDNMDVDETPIPF